MMQCAQCGHQNQPDFSFCEECGSPLSAPEAKIICPDCGHANQPDFNFCEECAAPLIFENPPAYSHAVGQTKVIVESKPAPAAPKPKSRPVSIPEPSPAPPAAAPSPRSRPEPEPQPTQTAAACSHCGFANPSDLRFCGNCGQSLQRKALRPKPKIYRRLWKITLSILTSLFIMAVSGIATRYAAPYVMDLVANMRLTGISQQEAVRQADNFVRAEYDDYLGVQPQAQKALDGQREVYAVAYSRGGSTLVVIVDAVSGYARLLPPDR